MSEDPDLEAFLRQFRPRSPAPLRRPGARRPGRWQSLAAGIAAALAVGAMLVRTIDFRPGPAAEVVPARPTLAALHAAVRAGAYEAALDEMDARVLPDPARPGGALAVLADVRSDW